CSISFGIFSGSRSTKRAGDKGGERRGEAAEIGQDLRNRHTRSLPPHLPHKAIAVHMPPYRAIAPLT
ncbi:MAG: hypothetical protein ICV54_26530, partial [Nostoc sp. C3-bin3]|nr:hypothetical protein [Nostoc sp. C3-bin3]